MLPCFVVLDLETTGGNAVHDRITEVAAVRIENGVEVVRWSSLVNPGMSIPPFIQSLTGISDAMVADAPRFEDVADHLLALLDGAVFVAHNVRFDHGFVLNSLERMQRPLKIKTLCTVRLSRRLYPQHKGHGLDAIMQRHGLQTQARHRAMGDVDMVLRWLESAAIELGSDVVQREALALLQGSASMPPLLETPLRDIPDSPGVYLMYGEGTLPLYVGKSIHMRRRVLSHFQTATRVAREMRIVQEIRRVEWRETAGPLGALLLESRLVKDLQPVHNRQLRRERQLCSWRLASDPLTRPLVALQRMDDVEAQDWGDLYGVYRSRRQAMESLREMSVSHGLCLRALGLESGTGPCFAYQIGRCKGLCCARETPALHRMRLQLALEQHRLHTWPHAGLLAIREYDSTTERTDIHVFDHWCHLATVHDEAALHEVRHTRHALAFDLDTYRLLTGMTNSRPGVHPELRVLPRAP